MKKLLALLFLLPVLAFAQGGGYISGGGGVQRLLAGSGITLSPTSGVGTVTVSSSGGGTVTNVSGVTANGFSFSIANPTTTPAITLTAGALTPTSVNGLTITTTTGTFTLTNGKTFAVTAGLTLSGTDSTTMTFPSTSATIARTDAANTFTGHQTIEGVTSTGATGTNLLVFGTSPTITTPTISGHFTAEGVTTTGATGTGNLVFSASPALTGSPTAPTQSNGDNSTKIATTAYVASNGGAAVANATGTISSTAGTTTNGSASTAMRSDGAPALPATMAGVNSMTAAAATDEVISAGSGNQNAYVKSTGTGGILIGVNPSATPVSSYGLTASVQTNVAKATTASTNAMMVGSSDSSNPLSLDIRIESNSTAASRAVTLQSSDIGLQARALRLNMDGGSVVVGSSAKSQGDTIGFFYFPTMAIAPTGTPETWGATSASVVNTADNTLLWYSTSAWHATPQRSRVSTQFDKTNTTLANITGLTANLLASGTYDFTAVLHVTADSVGGGKFAIAGTATATAIVYQINMLANTTNVFVATSRQTSLGGSTGAAGDTTYYTVIEGTITVNAAGTLTAQFAENAANGTSSVLVGSTFTVRTF